MFDQDIKKEVEEVVKHLTSILAFALQMVDRIQKLEMYMYLLQKRHANVSQL